MKLRWTRNVNSGPLRVITKQRIEICWSQVLRFFSTVEECMNGAAAVGWGEEVHGGVLDVKRDATLVFQGR